MIILVALLVFSTASCVLKVEPKHTKDGVSEAEQKNVPVGCADQLSFVKENIIEDHNSSEYGVYKHYLYKSQHECNASVIIAYDQELASDPVAFMDAKNIYCETGNDGGLLLNFPRVNDEKHQQVKFPCATKEIVIAKVPNFWEDSDRKLTQESKQIIKESRDELEADESATLLDKFSLELAIVVGGALIHSTKGFLHVARGYAALFAGNYKTFRKKILGGLAIIYSNHQQATLRNLASLGIFRKLWPAGYPHGVVGVSKEGSFIYHIVVDKDGKKQMLYPQE